jgi:hypothetical protein
MNFRHRLPLLAVSIALLASLAPAQDPVDVMIRSRLVAPPDPIGYYDTVQRAVGLFREQKYPEAATAFQAAVTAYPQDGAVWIYLGHALRLAGKPKEAVPAFQRGLDLTSTWQPHGVYYWMAQSQLQSGDKEGAYRSLERLLNVEQWVSKPSLYDDPAFAALKNEPRFKKLAGRVDTSKMSRTEGWRSDVDYLIAEVKRVNHKYRNQPLPDLVLRRQQDLKRDIPKLTDDQIFARMGHMLAPLKQGHVSLAVLADSKLTPLRVLPLQFYVFQDGVYITGADTPNRELVGSEVVKIENTPPAEVLRRLEAHNSVENPMKILWGGGERMGVVQSLRGIGVVPAGHNDVRLTLRSRDGKTYERVVASGAKPPQRKLLAPIDATPPMFLKKVSRNHWFEAMPEANAVFVQVNQVSPDPDETMQQFGLNLRKFLADNPVKNVIVDLRHNNGGNTATYTDLLRTLVGHSIKEGNRTYAIIGRGVYSATGNLIADMERLVRPIFVGEPSSGFGNQDGDESNVVLPYSGVYGWLTSVWWQYSHPWDRRTSVVPDIPVQLTAKDYFAGKDPVLETVLEHIRRTR